MWMLLYSCDTTTNKSSTATGPKSAVGVHLRRTGFSCDRFNSIHPSNQPTAVSSRVWFTKYAHYLYGTRSNRCCWFCLDGDWRCQVKLQKLYVKTRPTFYSLSYKKKRILIYSGEELERGELVSQIALPANVMAIRYHSDQIFVALANGKVEVFPRSDAVALNSVELGVDPVTCLLPINTALYASCENKVFLLCPYTAQIQVMLLLFLVGIENQLGHFLGCCRRVSACSTVP